MNDESLDLLDLDDGSSMDSLPEAAPFVTPRPKKPWLLLTVGLVVIILATYVIIRTVGGQSSSSIEVDLDAPAIVVDGEAAPDMNVMPPAPKPVVEPVSVQNATPGVPVRVVEDRKEVTFNPAAVEQPKPQPKPVVAEHAPKPVAKPVAKPAPKPAAKPAAKPAPKQQTASVAPAGSWFVQFGSYSTRALAEAAQKKIRASHASLFQGHQFVILAAQLKDGSTTYRLRIAFKTAADANGFCRNAKSDGLDCYVAK